MNQKFMIRHNLSMYGEETFAKKLQKKSYQTFFPFKDKGIDVVALEEKTNRIFLFQVKTRTRNPSSYNQFSLGNYWFEIEVKDIEKYLHLVNMHWVFGMLKENYSIDFFVVPISKIKEWIDFSTKNPNRAILGSGGKNKKTWWFQPTLNDYRSKNDLKEEFKDAKYITTPLKGTINITRYLFDEVFK